MNVGMLWMDGDRDRDLATRLGRAAAYYAEKYGRRANLCVIHPDMVGDGPVPALPNLAVRLRPDVLRDHVWIGVDEPFDRER